VILDGGIAQFGFDDRTYGQRAPAVCLLDHRPELAEEVRLCGPLCTPADRIAASVLMCRPRIGDLVGVFNVGAYGLTGNPGIFLGQGFAPELLLDDAEIKLIRRRFTAADYLRATAPDDDPSESIRDHIER
jgi:diaminopimelate decarboxylase